MKSDVYFFTARSRTHEESMSKVKGPMALEKLGFKNKVKQGDKVVIKTHFGALENTRYLRPSYLRFLSDYVKDQGGIPSIAESCGWGLPESISGTHSEYSGRANEKEYLEAALMHGFTPETMAAPIFMLDGPHGTDYELQSINGKRFNEVLVAGKLREFDYMVVATHFKGHSSAGYGGSIKNLGIGCVSKGGKVQAHMGKKFELDFSKCAPECTKCIDICPTGAMSKDKDQILKKDWDKCRYCYMCRSVCDKKVINIGSSTREQFNMQLADNAKGVVESFGSHKIFYINYAIDITWQCDCGSSDVPFVPDIGVLSSLDPVALDQACIDLVHDSYISPGSALADIDKFSLKEKNKEWFSYIPRYDPDSGELDMNQEGVPSRHWEIQLETAEEIGLGNRSYNLIPIEIKTENNH
ncbi:MAG: DUF362 domain-containing protein [Promethearchaeota archaeon]|nr:MAG: DUF362 domain-containing protein [Candidatus Lokiarchaeota archaeon]